MIDPKAQDAAKAVLEIIPLVMRTLGSELRHSSSLPTPGRFRLLFKLAEGPHNLSELAVKHNVSLPTMSNSVSALVERGLVHRSRDPHDRRQIIIELTPTGREQLAAVQIAAEARIARIFSHIAPEEIELLLSGLAVLRAAFTGTNLPNPP